MKIPFFSLLLSAALATLSAGCVQGSAPRPRNVLLISIDALRPDMLGCYGYGRPTSPTLDRLASGGVVFENAFTPSPWTLPAHGSLFTGFYPRRHGATSEEHALAENVETMAEILSGHGFATAAMVNGFYLSRRYGFDRGFQRFFYQTPPHRDPNPPAVFDEAVEWLSQTGDAPFFLFVHDFHVHTDYVSLPEYERMFLSEYGGEVDGSASQLLAFRRGAFALNETDVAHLVDRYAAGIRQADAQIDRLFRHMQETGIWENTLVIVISDHGEEFLEHGGVLHGRTHYDELMRVPLIVAGPGVAHGRRIEEPASLIDILPTTLSLLGLPETDSLDGIDLTGTWRNWLRWRFRDRVLFGEADHKNEIPDMTRSARYRGYKLVHDRLTGESVLYDLTSDPGERRDVKAIHPKIARRLGEEIKRFEAMTNEGPALRPVDRKTGERLEALGYAQ